MYNDRQSPYSPLQREKTEFISVIDAVDGLEEHGIANPSRPVKLAPLGRTLWRHAWIIAGVTVITTVMGLLDSYLKPYTYTGNFYLLVEPITAAARLTDPSTIARTSGMPHQNLTSLDYPTNLAFLQSPGMTFKIAQAVKAKSDADEQVAAIWKNIRDNLKVSRVQSPTGRDATKLFEVSYSGEDPRAVERVLRVAATTFVTYSAEDRETSIKAGVKFINRQLPGIQQTLDALKQKQRQLRERYQLIDPILKNQSLLEQLTDLENQKVILDQQLTSQKALVKALEADLTLTKDQAVTAEIFTTDEQRNQLLRELNQIEVEIASNRAIFTTTSPQLQRLNEQKANLEALLTQRTNTILSQVKTPLPADLPNLNYRDPTRLLLAQQLLEASNQVRSLTPQVKLLGQKIESIKQEIQRLPQVIDEFTALAREITLTETIVDRLSTQRETLKVEASQELPWQLISDPQIPLNAQGDYLGKPPNRSRSMALGFMGGLIISTWAVLLWERYRNVFHHTADLKEMLGFPILGEVPRQALACSPFPPLFGQPTEAVPAAKQDVVSSVVTTARNGLSRPGGNGHSPETAIAPVATDPNHAFAWGEETGGLVEFPRLFDELYTHLSFNYRNPPLQSVAFSSVDRGDGQSTMLLNLAIAAVAQGRNVLVVDGQAEHPCLHDWLHLNNQRGLSDYLSQDIALETVIQTAPDYPNLALISYGSQTEMTHLWLPKMRRLMTELQARYDLVLYDLNHFMDNTDVYNIAAETDGMVLVIAKEKTPKSQAIQAAQKASDLRLPVLGIIANFV
ncbi:MAG: hypothetical protein RLZZ568_1582 [Cyanobacteriota bacterium]